MGQFAADLKAEITADRKELEALMAGFQIPQSRTRKAAGWIAEEVHGTEAPCGSTCRQGGALRLLEIWDARYRLASRVSGFMLRWLPALDGRPELADIDLKKLGATGGGSTPEGGGEKIGRRWGGIWSSFPPMHEPSPVQREAKVKRLKFAKNMDVEPRLRTGTGFA